MNSSNVALDDPTFIVDNNVGKLAPWLRALGYDTAFINPIEDDVLIATARREGRIILTKDTGILRRRLITSGEIPALYIQSDRWREQLAQVVEVFDLAREPRFVRCLACNTPLLPATPEEAQAHVPPYVHRTQPAFLRCLHCGRYYWQGTHAAAMRREIAGAVGGGSGNVVQ